MVSSRVGLYALSVTEISCCGSPGTADSPESVPQPMSCRETSDGNSDVPAP
jgi:hypothetical protein